MKVLMINSLCGQGSTGRIVMDMCKIIEEQGNECLIAYGRSTAPEGINSFKIGTRFDNYSHAAKTRLSDKHGFGSTKVTEAFVKKSKEYDPDIIHLHNIHGYYINIEVLFNYLKEANKPVIWTLHDCWAFTGHCSYFDIAECDKWKTGCGNCVQKQQYPKSVLRDRSVKNYNKKKELFTSIKNMTIVTPSRWLADLVSQSYLGKYPIRVINNGIDLTAFNPTLSNFREIHKLEDKYVILGVANVWTEQKGINYFNKLAGQLSSGYKVVLVGVTKKQSKELNKLILCIEKTNNVQELAKIYSAADVYVNPTMEDNFPTTNLEALACGTPVITFNTGGSPESIDENSGIITDGENLLNSVIESQKMNFDRKYCSSYSKKFDKRDRYSDYVDIYKEHME